MNIVKGPLLLALAVAACPLLSACMSALGPTYQADPQLMALAPAVVFQGSSGPLSYHHAVGRDGQRLLPTARVAGRACQHGIQIPLLGILAAAGAEPKRGPGALSVGWGDGGYSAAIDDVRRKLPSGAVLYDVRADLNYQSYLTIYLKQCVVIDAGVLVPAPAQAGSPVADSAPQL